MHVMHISFWGCTYMHRFPEYSVEVIIRFQEETQPICVSADEPPANACPNISSLRLPVHDDLVKQKPKAAQACASPLVADIWMCIPT